MTSAAVEKPSSASRPYRVIAKFGLPLLVVAIGIATGLREPHFWSIANAQNLARQLSPLQIVVIGQLFALLSGGLDLSVASVMACSGVVGILENGAGPIVMLRADMDALPVREQTGLPYSSGSSGVDPDGHGPVPGIPDRQAPHGRAPGH